MSNQVEPNKDLVSYSAEIMGKFVIGKQPIHTFSISWEVVPESVGSISSTPQSYQLVPKISVKYFPER